MDIAVGAKTDVGLKRSNNEDDLCIDPGLGLYVVCDGMGGRNAGEVASRLAVETIQRHMQEARLNENLPMIGAVDRQFSAQTNRLASAIRLANQAIRNAAKQEAEQEGMGTTVVSAALNGQVLSVAHVGDSRIYLVRGDTIQQLTADHSLVAEHVRMGLLTEEEAERSPQKNIITRALGVDDTVDVALDEVPLTHGDRVLLCSDGLTRGVKPAEILEVLRREEEPQIASERLIELANAAGGLDNTTVILVTVRNTASLGLCRRVWNWLKS
ncbi:MAG TPA: Stp1/IreP family PP2C-type Ser/Thr phosphatase [Nitrospirales bacterium]|jgi:protein phosphatase|nr:Stp1/IreP family PP2C-type Ser/Thr phosphatase [Nitrospirales bacterium]